MDPGYTRFELRSYEEIVDLITTADKFVKEHDEFGMEELHPVLTPCEDHLLVELEFIDNCDCKHDRERCIKDYNATFHRFAMGLRSGPDKNKLPNEPQSQEDENVSEGSQDLEGLEEVNVDYTHPRSQPECDVVPCGILIVVVALLLPFFQILRI